MSVIIRLQNLPLTASSLDIRNFFHGLSIPDGGVHIVGGPEGDAFIAFSTDEDARQAMRLSGQPLKESRVSLLLSSRNEMYKVIEQARLAAISGGPPSSSMGSASSSMHGHHHHHLNEDSSPPSASAHHHLSSQAPPPSHLSHGYNHHSAGNSNSMSPTSSGSNDYMKSYGGGGQGGPQADLSSNPALLFSTMQSIPSATLGGGGAPASAYVNQQQHSHSQYPNLVGSSPHQQQNSASAPGVSAGMTPNLPFGVANNPAAAHALAGGANPFLNFPPPSNIPGLPFSSMLQGQGASPSGASNNPLAQAGNLGIQTTGVSGLLSAQGQSMNTTMSMAGQGTSPMNPFGTAPSRMSLMNNGLANSSGQNAPLSGGPRHNSNFGSGIQNQYGAGVGAPSGGPRQPGHFGPRTPFGTHVATMGMGNNNMNNSAANNGGEMKNRFQFGAIPSGRVDVRERDVGVGIKDNRIRSDSREHRGAAVDPSTRRRRSRSRERDRGTERRRRRSKSRSRSRSRSRDRSGIKRRDSRDKKDSERKSRSDSSPEKSSQDSTIRSRREQDPSPSPTSANTTSEEWPGAKLTGIPNDASYREIKEFIRAEVMGGSDGVVRLYDDGVAYLKLMSPQEFPRVYRSNGRKLRGSVISIEGITMETWTQEYKLNKSRIERDIDREREEREKEHEKESRRADRGDRDHRSERHHNHTSHNTHHRSSRFSNASHESSCIAIRGLAPTITRQELTTRYLQDTPCEDVVLIAAPTPTNRHSFTAFIQFESAHTAQAIIDLIARSPLGTSLVVESCDPSDLQRAKARTTTGAVGGNGSFGSARGNLGMGQDAKSIFELDVSLDDEATTVIMKGAPPNITERDVFDFFSDIGLAPMNVKIFHDADGQCSGNVICEFADNNKAKRATTKDGMLFGRGQISVSLLPSRNKRNSAPLGNPPSLSGGNDFGQQQNLFGIPGRNQGQRPPGLLGTGPTRASGAEPSMSRFSSATSSPNIFEQALQQQSVPGGRGGMTGGRGRGPSGERPSRFNNANDSRSDFRQNGFRGRGRGRGGGGGSLLPKSKHDDFPTGGNEDDLGIFNKKGCVIGLENIPYKASMDDILQYLEDTLKIRIAPNMIIRRFDDHQKPTGDARVAFNTEFEAKLACDRLKGTYMWKRLITATPDPDFRIDPPSSSTAPAISLNKNVRILCQRRLRKPRAVTVEV